VSGDLRALPAEAKARPQAELTRIRDISLSPETEELVADAFFLLHRAPAENRRPDQGVPRALWGPAHARDTEHAQPPRLTQHHKPLQQPGPDPNPRYRRVGAVAGRGVEPGQSPPAPEQAPLKGDSVPLFCGDAMAWSLSVDIPGGPLCARPLLIHLANIY
jgi:hypothetical protein